MKKFISWVLIIGSLTFAGLIIFAPPEFPLKNDQLTVQPQTPSVERLNPADAADNLPNVTEDLAKKIGEELIALNPQGPTSIQNEQWLGVTKPEELANKLFEETLANFDLKSLQSEVKLTDLKITPTADQSAIKKYAENFKNIVSAYIIDPPAGGISASSADLNLLVISYEKTLPLLYQLEVPAGAADIHRQGIAILETQKNILKKIINAENDPVTAIIAANLLPSVNQEAADFEIKLEKLLKS